MSYRPIYTPEELSRIDSLLHEVNYRSEALRATSCVYVHRRRFVELMDVLHELNAALDKRSHVDYVAAARARYEADSASPQPPPMEGETNPTLNS